MRRKDKEITDKAIIHSILTKAEICRLGLVEDGEAYIVPVNFAYNENSIFIHSARQGRKMDIIRQSNRVSFEIESHASIVPGPLACNWTTKYRSVMGKGTIGIVLEPEKIKEALDLIMIKYGWNNTVTVYDQALLSRICILKLNIDSMSGKQSGDWE
ncbi:MAG TPA: pyridoxamine 5'-phosphate oxidase family protein [Bacteroidales bacterium]|nr:pyridoxamine 5'-phosphate oxidase family protein [Bacteroidales bacterium]